MTESAYLSINLEGFPDREKNGLKEAKANGSKESMDFPNLGWVVDKNEVEFRDGELYVNGSLLDTDLTTFGYLSTNIHLDLNIVIDIIEYYMKRLGKLKTVLEATK